MITAVGCAKGPLTGKLYRVDNVYEEIWNLVVSEKRGTPTVLTTSIEGAYVDYDLGHFDLIFIPLNDMYRASVFFQQDELCFWLYQNGSETHEVARYVYNDETNTLYGDQEEWVLIDNFTSLYESWIGEGGKFDSEHRGDYTFVWTKYPLDPQYNGL